MVRGEWIWATLFWQADPPRSRIPFGLGQAGRLTPRKRSPAEKRRRFAQGQGAVALVEPDAPMIVKVPAGVIHETYITILDQQSGHKVITTIEVVRPSNKYAGDGRKSYKDKQREVLKSDANLVEIDLLRTGPHVLAVPESYARRKGFRRPAEKNLPVAAFARTRAARTLASAATGRSSPAVRLTANKNPLAVFRAGRHLGPASRSGPNP